MIRNRPFLLAGLVLVFSTHCLAAQKTPKKGVNSSSQLPHDESWVRDVDPNAPCKFGHIYEQISADKRDPRVAFVELSRFVHTLNPMKFEDLCAMISDQSEDTYAVFDKARGFLHIVWGTTPEINEALTYFSGSPRGAGIVLYMKRFGSEFNRFVFTYRNQEWQDSTKEYLGGFDLGPNVCLVVPQYGRVVRVLDYDPEKQVFRHKYWLRWTGAKFEVQKAKPKEWRCPDSYRRYFPDDEERQFCQ